MRLEDGRRFLYQWELNQKLEVPAGCVQVHFENGTFKGAISVEVTHSVNSAEATIPNELLWTAATIKCYAWDGDKVIDHVEIAVQPREKPADYIYEETEVRRFDTLLEALEKNTVDDTKIGANPWSSKNTVDKLCPSFTESGGVVICEPVEGYPLEVISTINAKDDGSVWESITLTQCGKNIFNGGAYKYMGGGTYGKATWNNGVLNVYGYMASVYLTAKPSTTYSISYKSTRTGTAGGGVYVQVRTASGSLSGLLTGKQDTLNGSFKFTTRADTSEIQIIFYGGGGTSVTTEADYWDIQLEIADAPTSYEPYIGQTLTANLSGHPVSEGSYDWITGVLIDDSGEMWQHDPENGTFTNVEDIPATTIVRNILAVPGKNSMYSDCGNTTVRGRLDPNKYWGEKLAEQKAEFETVIAEQEAELAAMNKQYELIEDITLEEAVASFKRTAEPNGVPYDFEALFIRIIALKASGSANINFTIQGKNGTRMCYAVTTGNGLVESNNKQTICKVFNDHGFADNYVCSLPPSSVSALYRGSWDFNVPWENVVSISFGTYPSSVLFPVGTRIQIYGVRG